MQTQNFLMDDSLQDLTKHHTIVMPVACYEKTIKNHLHGYIPLHWHDEIQFVLIIKGEALFQVNEEWVVVRQGDGLFINSGCLHMTKEHGSSDCLYICLNVSPHFVLSQELYTAYVKPLIHATNVPYLYIHADDPLEKNILNAVLEIHKCIEQKSPFYEIDITMKLTSVWKHLIANCFHLECIETEWLKNQRMKNMLSWIHQHYAEKITLEDIAKAGQLSRSECCRYFKRFLKCSPLHYVIDYRIQKSLYLLQQRDASVTDISYQVGFNSTSYFISRFRHAMKMTPLAYKKQKNKERQH
ncbi:MULTISPECIES: AraC family transcriptional regulator [Bacillus amyloliquefaciens group]|uniref:AraC family transcriptional regulator n=1 Tax=Bacillus amyloliquefaciens group TaxID=1938374 RepID=UPI00073C0E7C|nr:MULTISPECIES: helix-turn-helix domain-containing protein [Bacillus amyloliquefaciens group]KTF60286.1 transcriptional regulator [Bacillus amyloliquefaciens]MDM5203827.1 AraC family transcriptional regulator [Bacillus velezensis]NOL13440.1 helix-turn-helix domain-containing protein [Bacillus velezensis]QHC10656.1 helix-turn-helix domain-containing protein [Bacillus velezensis]WBS13515.1 AraC family transcriptional regulator [Bacillus velezensis]